MKKLQIFSFAALFIAALSIVMVACQKEEDTNNNATTSEVEAKSQIAQTEKALGYTLTKQTKTISDEKGNSVTLMVASKNKEAVENYLANMDIKLLMIDNFVAPSVKNEQVSNNKEEDFSNTTEGVILEVVSKSFGEGTKAFTLDFKGKTVAPNNLAAVTRSSWEFESQLFIEGFIITYNGLNCGNPGCYSNLDVEHWSRACALCSYKLYAKKSLSAGQTWSSCNDARRTKAKLSGTLPQTSYNYSFTFWNCA